MVRGVATQDLHSASEDYTPQLLFDYQSATCPLLLLPAWLGVDNQRVGRCGERVTDGGAVMPRPLQVAAAGDVLRPSGNRSISPEPASPPDDVLTVQETADLLRVDVEDVQTLITSGELPARRLGDQWRLSRTAVLAWLGTSNS